MRRGHFRFDAALTRRAPLILLASVLMGVALYYVNRGVAPYFEPGTSGTVQAIALAVLVGAGGLVYAAGRADHGRNALFHDPPGFLGRLIPPI